MQPLWERHGDHAAKCRVPEKGQNLECHRLQVCQNDHCSHSQVVDVVKEDLKELMENLGQYPERQNIEFEDVSELSHLLVLIANQEEDATVRQALEERVNELLDLFLLAQSLGDQEWMRELRQRLTKIMI